MNDICLVEDEKDLNQMLKYYLEKANYTVHTCTSILEAQQYIERAIPLWVIDIMLPDGNGLELLKKIKQKKKETMTIIISAKGDRFDRVAGFEIGCDDYIAKPFLPAELVFRVNKIYPPLQTQKTQDIILIPPYEIDFAKRLVFIDGEKVDITSREFDIILYFIEHKGQAISRDCLLNHIWGADYYGNDRIVDNYIKNIRRKLPELALETIYGYGYRYNL